MFEFLVWMANRNWLPVRVRIKLAVAGLELFNRRIASITPEERAAYRDYIQADPELKARFQSFVDHYGLKNIFDAGGGDLGDRGLDLSDRGPCPHPHQKL